jgi:hypothetical protein
MFNEHHNKLHSLNACAYFKGELEERGLLLDVTNANSVNRIKKEAPDLRQKGKSITLNLGVTA